MLTQAEEIKQLVVADQLTATATAEVGQESVQAVEQGLVGAQEKVMTLGRSDQVGTQSLQLFK